MKLLIRSTQNKGETLKIKSNLFMNNLFFSLTKSPVSYSGSVRSPYGPRSPCSTSGHGPSSNPYTNPHQYGLNNNNNNHGSTTATTFTNGFRWIFLFAFFVTLWHNYANFSSVSAIIFLVYFNFHIFYKK